MSLSLSPSLIIAVAAVCLGGVWAGVALAKSRLSPRKRPRMSLRMKSQTIHNTRVVDGMADFAPAGEDGSKFAFYVCYIRRTREKTQQTQNA